MRHRIFGKQLGRNHNQRQALLKSLIKSVFNYGSTKTTYAKAKSAAPLVEKLSHAIAFRPETYAKNELIKIFQSKKRVEQIYTAFKTAFPDQTSNFTRIVKLKRRIGDDALIVKLGFVKPYASVSLTVKTKSEKKAKIVKEKK